MAVIHPAQYIAQLDARPLSNKPSTTNHHTTTPRRRSRITSATESSALYLQMPSPPRMISQIRACPERTWRALGTWVENRIVAGEDSQSKKVEFCITPEGETKQDASKSLRVLRYRERSKRSMIGSGGTIGKVVFGAFRRCNGLRSRLCQEFGHCERGVVDDCPFLGRHM